MYFPRRIEEGGSSHYVDRNEDILDRIFETSKCNFEIKITPGKVKFWRFGFRFSRNEQFPSIGQPRHPDDGNIIDIHICVGDMPYPQQWTNPTMMYLTHYLGGNNSLLLKNEFTSVNDYGGEQVQLKVTSNDDASEVSFEVFTDNEFEGKRVYNLKGYEYCQLLAWSDYNIFTLNTEIRITHK